MERCSTSLIIQSVQSSCSVMSDSFQAHGLQHSRPPCPLPTPGDHSNSCSLSQWCHPTISSSAIIKEIQIKIKWDLTLHPLGWVLFQKNRITGTGEDLEKKLGSLCSHSWECKMVQLLCKTIWQSFQNKLNIDYLWSSSSTLGIYPKELKTIS